MGILSSLSFRSFERDYFISLGIVPDELESLDSSQVIPAWRVCKIVHGLQ
jgi:hypothetical protein